MTITTDPIDVVLPEFPDATKSGNGWEARCPAHEDRRASLSIGIGEDGRVLLYCHAGCTTKEIASAKGMDMKDLFPSPNGRSAKRPTRKHPKRPPQIFGTPRGVVTYYVDAMRRKHGPGVRFVKSWVYDTFHVLRFDLPTPDGEKQRKEFRPVHQVPLGTEGAVGWTTGYPEPDKNRPLYHRSEITAATDTSLVTVHGGEKATDAAAAVGLLATTNAGGEMAVAKADWQPLARFAVVAIVIDNDPAGEKFGRAVAVILKTLNPDLVVKIIRLKGPPKGDIVEWIAAGGTKEKFAQIEAETPAVTVEQIAEWKKTSKPSTKSKGESKFNAPFVAELICSAEYFAKDSAGKMYRYSDGAYRRQAESFVKRQVKTICIELDPGKWSTRFASEVVEFIRVDAPELWERPSTEVLSVKNGRLRIRDRKLLPHSPDHLSTAQLHFDYDPAAGCPAIEKFISEVFPADAVDLAWEIVGWLMVPNVSIQKAILLTGEGANGKSTFLTMLTAFIGKANVAGVSLHALEKDKFKVARLLGKLANICPDLPSDHLAGTSVFKAIVGGDTLDAEFKFRDSFDFVPFCRLVFSANHSPRSQDASHAFFRRWVVIPFDRTIEPSEQIPRDVLDAILSAPRELSGLLNKALDGRERLQRQHGFSDPESVKAAWVEFHATTDPLAVWLDKFTIDDLDAFVPKNVLRVAYNGECERRGRPSMNKTQFGLALKRARPHVEDVQRTVNGKVQWCYVGIGLLHPDDDTSRTSRSSRSFPGLFLSQGNEPLGSEENRNRESVEQSKENSVNSVNSVNDCPHPDVDETPTSDGYVNLTCRICGKSLRCREE